MKTLEKLLQQYHSRQSNILNLRFGQWFVNNYIDEPWSELYYEEDIVMAIRKIDTWLTVNGCERKMPKCVQESTEEKTNEPN